MYVGLDLGTSGLRGILVDGSGSVLCDAQSALSTQHLHSGWSEQDPQSWIDACTEVMAELRSSHPTEFANLRAIGISGHMHGATLLDVSGTPLRPCILWNDTRSSAEAAELDALQDMRDISGNIVFPGFTAPKLAWVRAHEPELFAKVAKVLLPKDYLRFWLTGEYISDMSDSAGTSWLDVGARDWSERALSLAGMRRDQMPDLVEGSAVGGDVRAELLAQWGLSRGVIVAGGAGDNAAAACGVGCFKEGSGFVSLGTSGVLLAAKDSFAPAPETAVHSFCHAIPDRWYQMGVILAATDSLNWLADTVGQSAQDLSNRLPSTASGPSSLTFLPYLSGERTPHNDAAVRGAFIGLDISMRSEAMTQAVTEGVAYAMRDSLEALKSTGTKLDNLLAVGGGSRSRFWLETLANVLQVSLSLPKGGELGAALGAARLAICADTGASPEDIMTPPALAETIAPQEDLLSAYEDGYQRYRALYPVLSAHQDGR